MNVMALQRIDEEHFNQVKGKYSIIHFCEGEPTYADIIGNAQMVYHLTEVQPDSSEALVGVNIGIGSDMRIYCKNREPERVTTKGNPDMTCYPPLQVPEDKKRLQGFDWKMAQRPRSRHQVFPQQ